VITFTTVMLFLRCFSKLTIDTRFSVYIYQYNFTFFFNSAYYELFFIDESLYQFAKECWEFYPTYLSWSAHPFFFGYKLVRSSYPTFNKLVTGKLKRYILVRSSYPAFNKLMTGKLKRYILVRSFATPNK
jgi:hypothetical protein